MEAHEVADVIRDQTEEASAERERTERFRFVVAVIIAGIAVLLAIVALVAQKTEQQEITAAIFAADSRSSADVKTATLASTQLQIADLERQLADPELPAVRRSGIQQQLNADRAIGDTLQSDPSTGLGIKELAASAEQNDREAEELGSRGESYDYGEVLLEIAVLIGSVALLTIRRSILGLALVATVLALLFFLNGFTLTFRL